MKQQLRYLLLVSIFLPVLAAQASAQAEPRVSPPDTVTSIPFDLRDGFLVVVEGRIGPIEHLRFILDTGSTQTVVAQKIADQLSLERQRSSLISFTQRVEADWAQIPSIQVGPIEISAVRMRVGDLGRYSDFARDVDGIIGMDLLYKCSKILIDYQGRTVRFQLRRVSEEQSFKNSNGLLVPLQVQHQFVRLLVDTGFQGILLYEQRLLARLHHIEVSETDNVRIGRLSGRRGVLAGLRIGSDESKVPIFLIGGRTDAVPAGIDGYFNPRALKAQKIELNFEQMRLRWQ